MAVLISTVISTWDSSQNFYSQIDVLVSVYDLSARISVIGSEQPFAAAARTALGRVRWSSARGFGGVDA